MNLNWSRTKKVTSCNCTCCRVKVTSYNVTRTKNVLVTLQHVQLQLVTFLVRLQFNHFAPPISGPFATGTNSTIKVSDKLKF